MTLPFFEYFQSPQDKQWYWHLKDGNYRIIAMGGQPFNSKQIVMQAIRNVCSTVPLATQMHDVTLQRA